MTKSLPEDAKNAMLGQIALGRFGEPADIARAAGAPTLDAAFATLTGVRDASAVSDDLLRALDRS